MVDQHGLHTLSCKFGVGRLSRHGMLNDIVHRAFTSAGIPAMKEPTGLVKGCALRPDGLTLIPWAEGHSLAWDVTVTHTRADKPRSLGSRRRLRSRGRSRSEIDQIRLTLSFALVRPSCPRDARAILQSGTRYFCGPRKAHRGKDRGPPRGCVPLSKSIYRYTARQRSGSPWQFW